MTIQLSIETLRGVIRELEDMDRFDEDKPIDVVINTVKKQAYISFEQDMVLAFRTVDVLKY